MLALLPGVQPVAGSGSNMYFAGHNGNQTDMGMDGIKEETLNSQTINMEFVDEMKVVPANNTAEYSRVGFYNTVSKRGGGINATAQRRPSTTAIRPWEHAISLRP